MSSEALPKNIIYNLLLINILLCYDQLRFAVHVLS